MAQKAEKMLPKILNDWLCNVQFLPRVWILKIRIKAFQISGSRSDIRFPFQESFWISVSGCNLTIVAARWLLHATR